jgi:hypothetical protein
LLFRAWGHLDSRATRDIDLLAYADNSLDTMATIVREVCAVDVHDDGLLFNESTIKAVRIKEDADYDRMRIQLNGQLGSARIHRQIDVGFGDTILPESMETEYPTLLDHLAPAMRAYPPETALCVPDPVFTASACHTFGRADHAEVDTFRHTLRALSANQCTEDLLTYNGGFSTYIQKQNSQYLQKPFRSISFEF